MLHRCASKTILFLDPVKQQKSGEKCYCQKKEKKAAIQRDKCAVQVDNSYNLIICQL